MNAPRKRASVSAVVPKTAVDKATTVLNNLPEKAREHLPLRDAMGMMGEAIDSALAKGYSLEEVAKMLNDKGVEVSTASLKYYLSTSKRAKAKGTTKRTVKPRAKKTESASATSTEKPSKSANRKTEDVISYLLEEEVTSTNGKVEAKTEPAPRRRATRKPAEETKTAAKAKPAARTRTTAEEAKPATGRKTTSAKTTTTKSAPTRGRKRTTT